MSDDDHVHEGEVLPPAATVPDIPVPTPLQGVPFFNRFRYAQTRKELEGLAEAVAAKNKALREIAETPRIIAQAQEAFYRLERLDDIRAIAAMQIDRELLEASSKLSDAAEAARRKPFEHRALVANAETDALEAEARLARVKAPLPEPETVSPPEPRDLAAELRLLRKEGMRIKATFIEAAGGEANLTEDDRMLIDQIEMAMRERTARLIEMIADDS